MPTVGYILKWSIMRNDFFKSMYYQEPISPPPVALRAMASSF